MLTSGEAASLDRYITGNYGEDQFEHGQSKPIVHLQNGVRCAACGKTRNTVRSIQRHIKKEHRD